jgi:hypothetical protein
MLMVTDRMPCWMDSCAESIGSVFGKVTEFALMLRCSGSFLLHGEDPQNRGDILGVDQLWLILARIGLAGVD